MDMKTELTVPLAIFDAAIKKVLQDTYGFVVFGPITYLGSTREEKTVRIQFEIKEATS